MLKPLKFLLSERMIGSASRHVGGAFGGAVLAAGIADADTALVVGGAVTTLAAFGLSVVKQYVL